MGVLSSFGKQRSLCLEALVALGIRDPATETRYVECQGGRGGVFRIQNAFAYAIIENIPKISRFQPVAPVAQRYHVTSDTLGREFDPGKWDFSH